MRLGLDLSKKMIMMMMGSLRIIKSYLCNCATTVHKEDPYCDSFLGCRACFVVHISSPGIRIHMDVSFLHLS